ncbi:ribokinase [Fervidibacillus halotolerans]|uniref:Ribokinase n=1 Tax=Fervidibacillus halotolerans TaxID=2980027 RepID=A0A9E8RX92_9BACI|nr:ribokinase [Fervidibacillus halotolerans]WAA12540.1 ribokinase [Fervidibacillus halotolerans]
MITVIGSLNMDLVTTVDRFPKLGETLLGNTFQTKYGGKGANQAIAASRLGGEVQMIGCVGEDAFGRDYLSHLKREGIIVEYVEPVTDSPTGTASIFIVEGDNSIVIVPGANFQLTPQKLESIEETIASSDMLLLQLEIPMETVDQALQIAAKHHIPTILNPAPFQPIPKKWWEWITYITPNEHEAAAMMADDHFQEQYKEKMIITNGKNGLLYYEEGNEIHIPAPTVKVVDTTGAGDTFNGALAYFLTEGYSKKEACQLAVYAASLSVTKLGAQGGMPTQEQLRSFIESDTK